MCYFNSFKAGITLLQQILISWKTYKESLQIYAIIDIYSPTPFVIMNQCWIIYISKRFTLADKILTLYFLLTFSRTKLTVVVLWILLVSVYPLSKLETFPLLTSVMSQDWALQQGASQLQTSTNLWTFPINITSPLRIHFPLLNHTELRRYLVTCVILLPNIKF
jgi:hypothetical protein